MLHRRDVLVRSAGLAVSAILGAGISPRSALAKADAASPVLLLRSHGDRPIIDALAELFRTRGLTPPTELSLDKAVLFDQPALAAELDRHRGYRMVGVMDDCSAVLLNETIRAVQGRIHCIGQHSGHLNGDGPSRHVFHTTPQTAGLGSGMAAALEGAASVREVTMLDAPLETGRSTPIPSGAWPMILGHVLGLAAAGLWVPVRPEIMRFGSEGIAGPRMASLVAEL